MTTTLTNSDLNLFSELTTNRVLELIIMPTENCNFRCTYCYEDFSIGKMKEETIEGIKNLLSHRAPNLDLIYIQWFGGEPLVASDIVLEISRYVQSLCDRYPQLSYRSSATTNGYLLDRKMFQKLTDAGVTDYQISLDGPEEIHNLTRITAGKKGTFQRIWDNLISMRESSICFSVLLRLHFKRDTVEQMKLLIRDIKAEFGEDPRFSVFFKAIAHLGGPNDSDIDIVPFQEQGQVLNEFKKLLYGDDYVQSEENSIHVCYAARPNALIIRANGNLAKCTVALYDERNNIGLLRSNGTLLIHNEKLSPWLRGLNTLDQEVLTCPLNGLPS